MVTFDNHFMPSAEAIRLVKSLFEKSFNGYIVESEYDETIYWQIVYDKGNIRIMFGSGRGILEYFIEKNSKRIDITKYEHSLADTLIASSEKNIKFVFDVMTKVIHNIRE